MQSYEIDNAWIYAAILIFSTNLPTKSCEIENAVGSIAKGRDYEKFKSLKKLHKSFKLKKLPDKLTPIDILYAQYDS